MIRIIELELDAKGERNRLSATSISGTVVIGVSGGVSNRPDRAAGCGAGTGSRTGDVRGADGPRRTHYTTIQRRLAPQFDVHLIPRRHLLRILRQPAHTTDGIHLTASGHEAMFTLMVELLGGQLAPVVRQDIGADRMRATASARLRR